MSTTWSDEETRELVRLWPTTSAQQIAKRLQRPLGAITAKLSRLRRDGVLPPGGFVKHFEVNPTRTRPQPVARQLGDIPQLKSAPARTVDDRLAMQPCRIGELNDSRCHWPLGDIDAIATMFCGGVAVPGRRYCAHHLKRAARGQGSGG